MLPHCFHASDPGANGTVRCVRISLPLIPALVDGQKYFLPDDLAAPAGEELRPLYRPRIRQGNPAPQPRQHFGRRHGSRRDIAEALRILGKV